MRPSIGRIVHYVARGSADGRFPPVHRVALVTETNGEDGTDEGAAPGTWHWPERDE